MADFIGQSNLFDVTGVAQGKAAVPDMGIEIPASDPDAVAISLRPERIRLAPGQAPDGQAVFDAVVEDITFFGPVVARAVRLHSGRVLDVRSQRSGHDALPAPGETIRLSFDPAAAAPLAAD